MCYYNIENNSFDANLCRNRKLCRIKNKMIYYIEGIDLMSALGDRIKQLRKEKHLTQAQFTAMA